jgi:hypothetical protein
LWAVESEFADTSDGVDIIMSFEDVRGLEERGRGRCRGRQTASRLASQRRTSKGQRKIAASIFLVIFKPSPPSPTLQARIKKHFEYRERREREKKQICSYISPGKKKRKTKTKQKKLMSFDFVLRLDR